MSLIMGVFFFFFPGFFPSVVFSGQVTLARTSRTMLNSNGNSGNFCLVPELNRKGLRNFLELGLNIDI